MNASDKQLVYFISQNERKIDYFRKPIKVHHNYTMSVNEILFIF